MAADTADVLAADTRDVLAADTRDVLAADTTDVLAADNNEASEEGGLRRFFPGKNGKSLENTCSLFSFFVLLG